MPRFESIELQKSPRHASKSGGRSAGVEWEAASLCSPTLNRFIFDEKPRLRTSKSTTTLNRVRGAFEGRYGRSATLPPGNPPLQSYYTPFDLGLRRPLARKFDHNRQLLRLLAKGFARWIVTVLIITAVVVTLRVYSHTRIFSSRERSIFNVLTTALLLILNINMQSSFKQAALFVRWKIIASRRQTLRELDLTLGIDSLVRVAKLAWTARAKPVVLILCILWLLMNMSMFALVASVQLTYTVEDSIYSVLSQGDVRIKHFDHFYPTNRTDTIPSLGAEQARAHYYGYISPSYVHGNASHYQELVRDRALKWGVQYLMYNMVDHWTFVFIEENPNVFSDYSTDRVANVTWLCSGYDVVAGGNGLSSNVRYLDGDTIRPFFVGETGPGATTYITETAEVCGPRCTRVFVFQSEIQSTGTRPSLYDCNITISNVSNRHIPEHDLPDMQARIAAGAIGLEGFQHANTTRQWVRYHSKDIWSMKYGNSPNDVGWLIAQFAAGTLGVAQEINPPLIANGTDTNIGFCLVVRWRIILLVLSGLGGIQLIVFLVAVLIGNSVVVKDDSRLAIARLLRPIVERLGSAGCILDGEDISKTLRAEVVYGVRQSGGWHHLDLGPDIKPLSLFGSFPTGWYDGEGEATAAEEAEEDDDQDHQDTQDLGPDLCGEPTTTPPLTSATSYWPEPTCASTTASNYHQHSFLEHRHEPKVKLE